MYVRGSITRFTRCTVIIIIAFFRIYRIKRVPNCRFAWKKKPAIKISKFAEKTIEILSCQITKTFFLVHKSRINRVQSRLRTTQRCRKMQRGLTPLFTNVWPTFLNGFFLDEIVFFVCVRYHHIVDTWHRFQRFHLLLFLPILNYLKYKLTFRTVFDPEKLRKRDRTNAKYRRIF